MTLVRSRYLLLSGQTYLDPGGKETRFAYSARQAAFIAMSPATASALASGRVAELDAAETERLSGLKALVPAAEDELAAVLAAYRSGSDEPSGRGFTIMPTSYCNMACDYCGQEHVKSPVNQARVDRIAARVEAAFADPATERVNVTWFGGEPLLALRVIRELSARFTAASAATGKPYTARMATNGSLLTARLLAELHHEWKLMAVDITIDGPEATHDQRRIKRNGIGSFHRTVAVLGEVVRDQLAPRLNIGIRVNVDTGNQDTIADLLTDLTCFGLASPQVELHLMPVHSWGNDVSAVELEARRYAKQEMEWIRLAQPLGLTIKLLPSATKRTTCQATTVYGEIIDSAGQIYSCSEHPLVPGARDTGIVARVTDLAGSAARPRGAFDDWYDQVGDGKQQCGRCPLLPVCGGSCPKLWREDHLPCPSMKFNWDDRVDLAAQRLGYRPAGTG
jgi:uncharacterized protein